MDRFTAASSAWQCNPACQAEYTAMWLCCQATYVARHGLPACGSCPGWRDPPYLWLAEPQVASSSQVAAWLARWQPASQVPGQLCWVGASTDSGQPRQSPSSWRACAQAACRPG